ncbi:ParB/RepB/Spo0J family partition protein [Nocardia fusca]|uniref:Transcriptional regulator n=1 Tax=Nocardia fusca TaxID=941183 RepID=A0ABV3FK88_9NOCA
MTDVEVSREAMAAFEAKTAGFSSDPTVGGDIDSMGNVAVSAAESGSGSGSGSAGRRRDPQEVLSRAPVEQIRIELISVGFSLRSRQKTDPDHVRMLTEVGKFPAITVHRATMNIVDGVHRYRAALAMGRESIAVRFFEGTESEAFVLAVHANVTHGLPLTLAERKSAARRILKQHPQWSDRRIAATAGLSHKTVGKERCRSTGEDSQSNGRVGRDGRTRGKDVSEGRKRAAELLKRAPAASLREISRQTGISVGTAKDVRDRLDGLIEPGSRKTPTHRSGNSGRPIQQAILGRLSSDPSLKFNEHGRQLLRRLSGWAVDSDSWTNVTTVVPQHCREALAIFARENASAWERYAEELESRLK